jgi:hypothetical protein
MNEIDTVNGRSEYNDYKGKEENELKTAQFWTLVEGESEQVRTFALIPAEWADKLDQHPQDDEIFYWCDEQEWLALGAGEVLGDAEVIACACDECEQEVDDEKVCDNCPSGDPAIYEVMTLSGELALCEYCHKN